MSLQVTLSPSKRAAGRYINKVRRALQKALAEETVKTGLTQADVARALGIDRSVVCRELGGKQDITLGRVGQLAWALGRHAGFDLLPKNISAAAPITSNSNPNNVLVFYSVNPGNIPVSSMPANDVKPVSYALVG